MAKTHYKQPDIEKFIEKWYTYYICQNTAEKNNKSSGALCGYSFFFKWHLKQAGASLLYQASAGLGEKKEWTDFCLQEVFLK